MNMNIQERAKEFARKAHEGHFLHNLTRDPMIKHPEAVAKLIKVAGGTDKEIAAAWLHDVVEDTEITIEEVAKEFGDRIAEIVNGLTDPADFAQFSHPVRKKMQADRVIAKSSSVKKIKLADQLDNVRMAGEGSSNWNPAQRLECIEAARVVASNCKGSSDKLDKMFNRIYQQSLNSIEEDLRA